VIGLARAAITGLVLALLAIPGSTLADVPVTVQFDGSGSFTATNMPGTDSQTTGTVALDWTSVFGATEAQDGTLTPTGLGTLTKGPGTFQFSDPSFSVSCSGNAPVASFASPPSMTVNGSSVTVQSVTAFDSDGSSGGYASCQGKAPGSGLPFDGSGEAASNFGTIDPSLPGVLSATVQIPSPLTGPVTLPVTNANAPAQVPPSCADQFGDDSCTMSLSWSGTVTVSPACASVSFSDGGALPVGTAVAIGQTVSTGKGQRLELTTADGAIVRIGPESTVVCQAGPFVAGKRTISVKLILGEIWAAVSDALGGNTGFQAGERAGTGVRGSEFTLDMNGRDPIAHVVEGTGYVKYKGKREFHYAAGLSAIIGKRGVTLSSRWPAADRALVPAGKLPPRLTKVKLHGPRGRPKARLTFKLDQKSSLRLQVLRGKKIVAKTKLRGKKGANSLHPFKRKLRKGRYTLRLTATAKTRSTSAQLSFNA
jgi:hypothetical protein